MIARFLCLVALLMAVPVWGANERAKTDRSTKTHTLIVVDDTTGEIRQVKSTVNGLKVDSSAGGGGVVDQGISGVSDADPWNIMLRDSSGVELGLAASPFASRLFDGAGAAFGTTSNPIFFQNTAAAPGSMRLSDGTSFYKGAEDRTLSTAPFSMRLSDGTSFYDGATDRILSTAPFSMRLSDGTSFYDGAQDRILATVPFAVRQSDGTSFFKAAEDRTTSGAPSSSQLSNGSAFYAAMDQATGDDIELNTDSPTVFASATFSVGTSAVEIAAASATRRSLLIRNADSNTVLFVGPTSGVTTANGIPINTAGASGANGNGGTIIYSHTAAVWAIVSSGTADTRTQSESD